MPILPRLAYIGAQRRLASCRARGSENTERRAVGRWRQGGNYVAFIPTIFWKNREEFLRYSMRSGKIVVETAHYP
jgi:hypothetical protein